MRLSFPAFEAGEGIFEAGIRDGEGEADVAFAGRAVAGAAADDIHAFPPPTSAGRVPTRPDARRSSALVMSSGGIGLVLAWKSG